ncbi:hypothetical protein EO98_09200 [Methanosarcina sp. 2.H.T.1A.6]|nr:hypothetical protein EO94_15590 [Methanosarcina sp. 2.H.T.1A.3]KKG19632.1 hypothetical protein EO98_09200 [Methanosarcina sp. 2.H.T.1A.6]KKG22135.1 hypothetical protein EO97_17355 [Methanosarcina sp. 2.H.T.1A.15]KKG26783.1 hypothetical protein EO96_02465 [Methanosarcina sp. 2.H.T.1A.8]
MMDFSENVLFRMMDFSEKMLEHEKVQKEFLGPQCMIKYLEPGAGQGLIWQRVSESTDGSRKAKVK